jgi:alkylation response protein AidB-like acyl-CoA dehydrogenase
MALTTLTELQEQKMAYENFLMNLYFGSLDAELFDSFKEFQVDESTRGIIQNYLEVNSEYPASVMEEKGMVPSELLEKLGRNDFFGLTIPKQYGGVGLSLRQYLHIVFWRLRICLSGLKGLFCLAMRNRSANISCPLHPGK